MNILVTGGAGFIGAHTVKALADRGHTPVIVDDFNNFYDPQLKEDRIGMLLKGYDVPVYRVDIRDTQGMERVFSQHAFDTVCHLAAYAGVRASLEQPRLYYDVNVMGTVNLMECAVRNAVGRFVFASSSSVYGNNKNLPFREDDPVDHPISPYAVTKKICELIGYCYHHLHGLSVVGLRYFTVYGPWGRPDMALFCLTRDIVAGKPIKVYNHGVMRRDFTYIDDIVQGTVAAIEHQGAGYDIVNLGNNEPEDLLRFITVIEQAVGKTAQKQFLPIQPGDVEQTYADIQKARSLFGFSPQTSIDQGIPRFVQWYRDYFHESEISKISKISTSCTT